MGAVGRGMGAHMGLHEGCGGTTPSPRWELKNLSSVCCEQYIYSKIGVLEGLK